MRKGTRPTAPAVEQAERTKTKTYARMVDLDPADSRLTAPTVGGYFNAVKSESAMGQAFDRTGAMLGEAQADTMREVLDKLEQAHPDAAEIRITRNADDQKRAIENALNEKDRELHAEIDRRQEAAFIAQDRMLQFFVYGHLPPHLQDISRPFRDLAANIVNKLPSNPERTVALRKLLEAKDCAVRALLYKA